MHSIRGCARLCSRARVTGPHEWQPGKVTITTIAIRARVSFRFALSLIRQHRRRRRLGQPTNQPFVLRGTLLLLILIDGK